MIPPDHQQRLRPWLLPGERLLWSGTPEPGIGFRRQDLWLLPLGGLWAASTLSPPSPLSPWGVGPIPLLLAVAAAYIVLTRLLHEPWLKRGLLYAVTNQRVLILRGRRRPELRSHDLAWLPMLDLEQDRADRGTIVLDQGEEPGGWLALFNGHGSRVSRGSRFFRVERPAFVYDLIGRAARERRADLNRQAAQDFIG